MLPDCGDTVYSPEPEPFGAIPYDLYDGDRIALKVRTQVRQDYELGRSFYMSKSKSESYLARCEGCVPDVASSTAAVHVIDPSRDIAQWTVRKLDNGKIALQADNGIYLARCHNCIDDSYTTTTASQPTGISD